MRTFEFGVPTIGVLCSLLASFAFTLNDSGIKFLSGSYPLHEIILIRAMIAMFLTLIIFVPLDGGIQALYTKQLGKQMTRGLIVVLANLFFFLGLASIPLAEATAIFFVAPLVIMVFSVIFLKEIIGPWRWFAVAIGFTGTLLMFRPTPATFQIVALLPLAAAVCYAATHIYSRTLGKADTASALSFYVQVAFILTCGVMWLFFADGLEQETESPLLKFLFRPWIWPNNSDLVVMTLIGLGSCTGSYFISQAYRLCDAALIAPFEYVALVLAIIWGISFFREWPDTITWIGSALILCGGLLMLWRETVNVRNVRLKAREFKAAQF